jgi:serine/threonine-protein kinase
MLAGARPFSGANVAKLIFEVLSKDPVPPHHLNPDVPPELSEVVLKALRKRKEERYVDCSEFLKHLRRFC